MGMLLRRHYAKNMAAGATKKVAPKPEPNKPAPVTEKKADYTEEMIKSMNGAQLRKLAKKNGVENPEEFTLKELKSVLCGLLVE